MSSPPFMKLFWNDLLASCIDMDATAFGSYMRLLGYQWLNGYLPVNSTACRRVADCSENEWPTVWATISHRFTTDADGKMYHQRLRQTRDEAISGCDRQDAITEKRREAGKLGAAARWQTDGKCHGKAISKTMANDGKPGSGSRSIDLQSSENEEADQPRDLGKKKRSIAKDLETDSTQHKKQSAGFKPPCLQEWLDYSKEYAEEANYEYSRRDSEGVFDHFVSVGWKIGSGKAMKDWQAACRNAVRRNAPKTQKSFLVKEL